MREVERYIVSQEFRIDPYPVKLVHGPIEFVLASDYAALEAEAKP